MPASDPTARLWAIVARQARVAVVFRRGPSKRVRMLRWDLATDTLEAGQWLSGRLYEDRCDLSPDGALLVYFAGKFRGDVETFTAISRPPFFTPLAFWPGRGAYGGGGAFTSRSELVLGTHAVDRAPLAQAPTSFEVRPCDAAVWPARHGFSPSGAERGAEDKPSPAGRGLVLRRSRSEGAAARPDGRRRLHTLVQGAERCELGRPDWADWDHDGSLLVAERGCLFRRDVARIFERPGSAAPRLVADLRAMRFEAMAPPPEAKAWPFGPQQGQS